MPAYSCSQFLAVETFLSETRLAEVAEEVLQPLSLLTQSKPPGRAFPYKRSSLRSLQAILQSSRV